MARFSDIKNRINDLSKDSREIVINSINESIKECVSNNGRFGGIDYSTFCRFLCMYAMSISDEERRLKNSKSNYNAPQWKKISEGITDFVDSLPDNINRLCCQQFDNSYIQQFATLASRRQGSRTQGLYSTIALYICYLQENDAFKNEFMQTTLSSEDRRLPTRLIRAIDACIDGQPADGQPAPVTLGMHVSFEVAQTDMDKLANFVDRFVFGDDQCAHMVLYRPMRRDPKYLMKSFLSVSPPYRKDNDNYTHHFTNIYSPPGGQGNWRIGNGRILPLKNSIYFVGGQKPNIDGYDPTGLRTPFTTMKIMSFRWMDFENQHSLIPGVVLTADYEGKSIVSRIVARLTPVKHSKHIELGDVAITGLCEDIQKDFAAERKAIDAVINNDDANQGICRPENASSFDISHDEKSIEDMAKRIVHFSNNNPAQNSGWKVPDEFTRDSSSKMEELNENRLMGHIDDALQSKSGAKYTNSSGSNFDLWNDIRFAPIYIE